MSNDQGPLRAEEIADLRSTMRMFEGGFVAVPHSMLNRLLAAAERDAAQRLYASPQLLGGADER